MSFQTDFAGFASDPSSGARKLVEKSKIQPNVPIVIHIREFEGFSSILEVFRCHVESRSDRTRLNDRKIIPRGLGNVCGP